MTRDRARRFPIALGRLCSIDRVVSLAIVASFLLPFGAMGVWLHVQKALLKEEVKARLLASVDKAELIRLVFSKAQAETELDWEEEREFEYKGEMYDVLEAEEIGDSIRCLCWRDDDETELNRRLRRLVAEAASGSPEHKEREKRLYQWLKSLALNPDFQRFPCKQVRPLTFASLDFKCRWVYLSPESPPPKRRSSEKIAFETETARIFASA
ncbi:MAG: hypothetical protein NZM06_03465 [Chloroherpetonaceae bacterium]|nr:hypothetical protein [Chloroherpetonaceae bacterium]MDW8437035.1 hypothetical protein [Chloroherpetonaceae bacterium]